MSDIIARGMAANAMSSGGGGGGGTTVDAYNKQETDSLLRGKANASDVYTTTQTDDLLDDKVNKVEGKGLSTNDYTNEDMSLVKTISNKANKSNVDTLVENLQNQINETNGNVDSINTELMTNAGYSLGMSINSDYQLTMTLKNSKGDGISSQSIDLPIESMVVGASYANGTLSLKLQNNDTLDVDVSAIVAGLVNQNFTIAGIDMQDNIEANELRAALGVYTTTEVDNKLSQKANASTTYSKTEVDNKVSTINTNVQANTTAINATNERVTQIESDILSLENDVAINRNAIAVNRNTLGFQKKNLIDQSIMVNASGWTVDENGVYSGTAHNLHVYVQNGYPIETEFRENTQYTLSYDIKSEVNTSSTDQKTLSVMAFYTDGTSKLMGYHTATGEFEKFTATSLAGKTLKRLRFEYYNNRTCYIKNMQLEEGTIATEYEPYVPSVNERLTANENDILRIYQDTQGATLNAVGWYRIFEVNKLSSRRSAIINIARGYGEVAGETITLLLNLVYMDGTTKFADCNVLDKLCRVQYLDKIRVVASTPYMTSNIAYIDLHYNTTKPNNVNAVILGINSGGKNVTNFTPINLTKINEIGEEYTAIEFDLTGGDIFDRLTALETALAQTTASE